MGFQARLGWSVHKQDFFFTFGEPGRTMSERLIQICEMGLPDQESNHSVTAFPDTTFTYI